MRPCVHRTIVALLPRAFAIATLASLWPVHATWAQLPGEATELVWCPASKDCLSWSASFIGGFMARARTRKGLSAEVVLGPTMHLSVGWAL